MRHLLKIMNLDMNLERTIPEYVIFDTDKAVLLYECKEKWHFLWIRMKDHYTNLYLTAKGSYIMERYYEGEKPDYEVVSKGEAAEFVRVRDKEAYIKIFRPREL